MYIHTYTWKPGKVKLLIKYFLYKKYKDKINKDDKRKKLVFIFIKLDKGDVSRHYLADYDMTSKSLYNLNVLSFHFNKCFKCAVNNCKQ